MRCGAASSHSHIADADAAVGTIHIQNSNRELDALMSEVNTKEEDNEQEWVGFRLLTIKTCSSNIEALLTLVPLKEFQLKSQYVRNKEAKVALGVKIAANDLEGAIAGSRLLVVGPEDGREDLEEEVMLICNSC